MRETVLKNVC